MKHIRKIYSVDNWRTLIISAIVLVLLPSLYYGLAIRSYAGTYSPFDEQTHIGYAWSVAHGHIPAKGETLPPEVLNDWACSGWRSVEDTTSNTAKLPACNSGAPAKAYPGAGEQYNSFHPPLYYLITGFIAQFISSVFSGVSFAHAAQYLSILWMVAGLIALYFALCKWNVSSSISLATCAIVPYIPVFLNAGSAVTNDAPALLCGAGFLWIAARFFIDKNYNPLIPCIIAFVACMIKGTFAFPLLALLTVMGLHALIRIIKDDQRPNAIQELIATSTTVIITMISVYGWTAFQSHRGNQDYVAAIAGTNSHTVQGLPIGEFLNTFMMGFDMSILPGDLRNTDASAGYAMWLTVLRIVLIGAVFYLYFQNDSARSRQLLMYSTLFGMLLVPSLVQIREYLGNDSMFGGISPRYGMTLVPMILCCWALAVQNRKQPVLAWGASVIGMIICFISVLGIAPFTAS